MIIAVRRWTIHHACHEKCEKSVPSNFQETLRSLFCSFQLTPTMISVARQTHRRSIKHVYMCTERHHPIPTPPHFGHRRTGTITGIYIYTVYTTKNMTNTNGHNDSMIQYDNYYVDADSGVRVLVLVVVGVAASASALIITKAWQKV